MALAHDIAESRVGDVHYLSRQYVKRDEKNAVKRYFSWHGSRKGVAWFN